MSKPFFLDTNVFVASFDPNDPSRQEIALGLIETGLKSAKGCVSHQVVQEFLSLATRRFVVPLKPEDAEEYLRRVLVPMWSVHSSLSLMETALAIRGRWSLPVPDSMVIAAALESRCEILYSEDLPDGAEYALASDAKVKVVNPFGKR